MVQLSSRLCRDPRSKREKINTFIQQGHIKLIKTDSKRRLYRYKRFSTELCLNFLFIKGKKYIMVFTILNISTLIIIRGITLFTAESLGLPSQK